MSKLSVVRTVLMALLSCLAGPAARAADAPPPNVVLIISDDQAWTDFGFMGHPHVKTPNLDKLAAQSLTFKRGYVPASLCCPSLAAIVTGLYPHQNKITSNDPPVPADVAKNKKSPAYKKAFEAGRDTMNKHLEEVQTLPKLLTARGYLTLQTGKWWQGHYSHGGFTHGMTKGSRHGDEGLDIGRKTMQPIYDVVAEAKAKNKPFMVWYAPMMPHTPHTPPAALLEKYKAVAPTENVAKYWAMCDWFDQTCGQLLDHLDQQGVAENTIVMFVTDNGWIQQPNGNNYAPKSKQSQYDGGLRTPIMIRWPGKVQPKTDETNLAMSIDLYPTLLKVLGEKPRAEMPGIDLLDAKAVEGRKTIFGECFTHDSQDLNDPARSLRWRWAIEGNMKLIVPAPQNEKGGPELYDLAADPMETKNLASEKPEVVERLTKKLDDWWPGKV